MNDLVYPRERTFGTITLLLGLLIWLEYVIRSSAFMVQSPPTS